MARCASAKSSPRRHSGRIKAKKATHGANTKTTLNLLTLPLEILSMVFEIIICQEPYGDTDASNALADYQVCHEATNFLLTCHYFYDHFAPLYWQKRIIVFTDPVQLANDFLAFASDTATVNLKGLRYIIPVGKFVELVPTQEIFKYRLAAVLLAREVRKFREVLNLYQSELKNLKSLTVELNSRIWLTSLIFEYIDQLDAEPDQSANQYWEIVDRICKGCFGQLEKTVRRTILNGCKDFHIAAGVDFGEDSALARNSLFGLQIQTRPICEQWTLTFGRDD